MQKLILIITLSFLTTGITYSQVFISSVVEGVILLGPDNVNHHKDKITNKQFSKIEKFKDQLKKEERSLTKKIKRLKAKKQLSKKRQNILNAHEFYLAKVIYERALVNKLIATWMTAIKTKKTLLALSHLSDEVCFEIDTDMGTYRNDQLKISRLKDSPMDKYDAFIPIGTTDNGSIVESFDGAKVVWDSAPMDMKTSKNGKVYYLPGSKRKKMHLKLGLISKETNEQLEIISWQKIDCSTN